MENIQLLTFVGMLTWMAWELGVAAAKHGTKRDVSKLSIFIATICSIVLLYFGGFFVVVAWPHIIWFILSLGGLFAVIAGYLKNEKYNFSASLFAHAIVLFLYLKGGFWYTGFIPFQ